MQPAFIILDFNHTLLYMPEGELYTSLYGVETQKIITLPPGLIYPHIVTDL